VHTIKVCEGVEVQCNSFLTLALEICEWSTLHLGETTLVTIP